MSDQLRKQGDPLLRAVLDSARLDEPPAGAEEAMLAALGLGGAAAAWSGAKLGASHAPLATGASALAKAAPLAAKLLGVLGMVGLGAVAYSQQAPRLRTPRDSERPMAKRVVAPVAAPEHAVRAAIPLLARPETAPPRASLALPHPDTAALAPAAPTPPGDSLEIETRLLAAARSALAAGDKSAARAHLRQYEREVTAGSLQREADILWERAR